MSIRSPRRWLLAAVAVAAAAAPGRAAPDDDLEALQKKVLDKLLKGDPSPQDLAVLLAEMSKMMRNQAQNGGAFDLPLGVPLLGQPGLPFNRQLPLPFPPARGGRFRPEVVPPGPAAETPADKQLKEFDEAIEKLKDDPDAQAELKKARDEYKKALEDGLKKGGGGVERPAERPRPVPRVEPGGIDIDVPIGRGLNPVRPAGPVRLGVVFERPSAVLADHLNLPDQVGVVIVEVAPNSPADKAGLRKNDVVVKLAGKDAPSELPGFQALVAGLKAGEKFEAVLFRKGKKETVALELAADGR